MSAECLLSQLVFDLESEGQWCIALDLRRRAARLLCDRDDDEAAVIGVIDVSIKPTKRLTKEAA